MPRRLNEECFGEGGASVERRGRRAALHYQGEIKSEIPSKAWPCIR